LIFRKEDRGRRAWPQPTDWTDKFGVSKAPREEAMRSVGSSAEAVEKELRRSGLGGDPKQ